MPDIEPSDVHRWFDAMSRKPATANRTLPVFSRRAKRKLIAQPKFYFFDSGVFRAIRPMGPLDSEAELVGQALKELDAILGDGSLPKRMGTGL